MYENAIDVCFESVSIMFFQLLTSVLIGFLGVTPKSFSLTVAVSTLGVKSLVESWVGSAALGSI